MENEKDSACLERAHSYSLEILQKQSIPVLPEPSILEDARSTLLRNIPEHGLGIAQTTAHLLQDITPALNASSLSPTYYGFVVGGVTPAARVADSLVSTYDQTPSLHLPDQTVASNVEDKALRLLMDLLRFDQSSWSGVFSTGATASNVLGLACGREYILNERIKSRLGPDSEESVGSLGLLQACRTAGVEEIDILTTMAHSSLFKASSILGLGRNCVHDVGTSDDCVTLDLQKLEQRLKSGHHNNASIVVISCGEVNTGFFATHNLADVQALRTLCDRYGAWLHVDGAFGLFARILDGLPEFETVAQGARGLTLADSIAGDGHKLLNVPYDCGFFLSRHPSIAPQVFQNPNAAYLNTKNAATDMIQSALNIGIENSRRFRGLPVYATLMAYGRQGYAEMLKRQVRFARAVAAYLFVHADFELLPSDIFRDRVRIDQDIFIIVLFKAKNEALNNTLAKRINASSKMCVSGTVWDNCPASRIAVSNWQVDPDRDMNVVRTVFEGVLSAWAKESSET
ncbi:MAG: hypothetical protein ASARMPRED_001688 [Alectoria sarmentosa]|nr:MAG: hypothetical protein ASARMPRED_001688 [Alectoria sarmentosa]